jgi:hypothetical protein
MSVAPEPAVHPHGARSPYGVERAGTDRDEDHIAAAGIAGERMPRGLTRRDASPTMSDITFHFIDKRQSRPVPTVAICGRGVLR